MTDLPVGTRVYRVETPVHGRVLVREAGRPSAGGVLVGFHGYAENASIQMERLTGVPGTDTWLLVSIQGLNRFYRPRSEETVASWMTREDRDLALTANVGYVNRALDHVLGECAIGVTVPVVLAGFSQGVAMAFRAAVRGSHRADGVIAVGGDVPPELVADADARFPPALLIRGARDAWYTQAKLDADQAALTGRQARVSAHVIDGGHEWTPEVSNLAASFLQSLPRHRP